ncbi:MAG: TonB-dependent receptor [Acidobacteria bacterium]|nr:TonB-dependent receptor [Acidobacteriota bacterium]
MRACIPFCLLMGVLLTATVSFGQAPTAIVTGQVIDASGGVVPDATVEITNEATNITYPSKTNNDGFYSLPNLQPGTYRLQVSKSGFKTIVKPDIVLHVQDARAINFSLTVGAVSEIVTVEGGAPLVNTESAAVSTVIDHNFVERLPLNGRSFNTLLQLTPGVVIVPTSGQTFGSGAAPGQFSIAGQRSDANNFTVDGVSANFGVTTSAQPGQSGTGTAQAFSALGGTSSLVSVEALQEFRIETSSFAAEFGRAPGGQVILTTRSGTNQFHGSIYEYFRNDVMDGNDWFANQLGLPRAAQRHNDFGGFFGGPILKDKTFFFFAYEGARLRLPRTTTGMLVPSSAVRASAAASPNIAAVLNAYPVPNGPISPGGDTAQYSGSFSDSATLNATSLRLDHSFNSKFSVFGRYSYAPSRTDGPLQGAAFSQTTPVNTQTFTAGVNMLLSSRLTNTVRGNYSTQSAGATFSLNSLGGAVPLDPALLFSNLNNGQNLATFNPLSTLRTLQFGPQVRNKTRQFNFVDDLSLTFGTHHMKFGVDYRGIFLDVQDAQHLLIVGVLNFGSFVSSGNAFFVVATTQDKAHLLSHALSLYGQDSWKISPRLTMTYGLRWELSPPPSARNGTTLAAWQNADNPAAISLAPEGTPLWETTYGNFAPRLGIAYRLTSRGDLVFRAGGGIFYDLGQGKVGTLASLFPNFAIGTLSFNVPFPVADWNPFLPSLSRNPPFPSVSAFSPDLELPRSYQWSVALEKSFGGTQAVSITYVGQAGRELLRQESTAQPNSNFRPASVFRLTRNNARSNYNAFQVQFRRPLANRLQALLNYTWSHSLDTASDDVAEAVSDAVISAANDYASSDFDVRQSFSGAITYDIPAAAKSGVLALVTNGWSVDTVIVARTGFPFSAFTSAFTISGAFPRADLVPGQPIYLFGAQCAMVFQSVGVLTPGQSCPGGKGISPNAFTNPPSGQQGNSGRNILRGFGLTQVDLSFGRRFALTERLNLQFRADAFNVLNHPNFANPNPRIGNNPSLLSRSMLNNRLGGLNPLFQEGGPRSLQLSLKLSF